MRLVKIWMTIAIVFVAAATQAEQLTFIQSFEQWPGDPEARVSGVVLSPDGRHLYVARSESYFISIFDRDPGTGVFTYVADAPNSFAAPICDVVEGIVVCHSTYSSIRLTADGRFLYACIPGDIGIIAYERDLTTGLLTQGGNVPTSGWACNLALSSDDGELYVATNGQLHVLGRDPVTGVLTPAQTLPGVEGLDSIAGVATSGDGQNIYVTGAHHIGSPDGILDPTDGIIAVFRRDSDSGAFQFEDVGDDGIDLPDRSSSAAGVVVSPDGAFVYVATPVYSTVLPVSGAVVVFSRAPDTGRLTWLETKMTDDDAPDKLEVPHTLVLTPDGSKLLVVGQYGLALFGRDAATGKLTFLGRDDPYCNYVNVFRGGAFSADGADFYVGTFGGAGQGFTPHVMRYRIDDFGCAPAPSAECAAPVSSSVAIRNDANDNLDKITWDWSGIDLSGDDDLVDGGGGFAVCIYSDAGLGPQLAHEAYAPAGSCWYKPPGGDTLSFSVPHGSVPVAQLRARITSARIKSKRTSIGFKQKIRVIAKKLDAEAPALPLPDLGATRVQFVRNDGHCWEAGYAPEQMSINSALKFKAKTKAP